MTNKIIVSGFGGQGTLTLGVLLCELGLMKGKKVSWLPSYGAEMRGGTANCTVIISDEEIGAPIVTDNVDILVAMNTVSVEKFNETVASNGIVLFNSSIVDETKIKSGLKSLGADATKIANDIGNAKVQNIVMLGLVNKHLNLFDLEDVKKVFEMKFGEKRPELIDLNIKAFEAGMK